MRRMAASVLVFEAFIALFFGLVAAKLHPSGDWVVALVLGAVCVLLAGMMRFQWAYPAGWALQVGFIAAGFLVTDMFFLGAVFTAIWWAGLHYGAKAELIKAERVAAYEAAAYEAAAAATETATGAPTAATGSSTAAATAATAAETAAATAATAPAAETAAAPAARGSVPTSAATSGATSTEHPGVGTR